MPRRSLLLFFISIGTICLAQSTPGTHDSLQERYYAIKWLTAGINYDMVNKLPGVVISNGFDELPLIHFEDISAGYLYKLQAQTNFTGDYTFGGNLLYRKYRVTPWLYEPTVDYFQSNIASIGLFQRNANLSAQVAIKGKHYRKIFFLPKIGYQQLNNYSAPVIGVGYNKRIYPKAYSGFMIEYNFKYINYHLFMQGFIVHNKVSLRATYDKIGTHDFLNFGLHFSFHKMTSYPLPK